MALITGSILLYKLYDVAYECDLPGVEARLAGSKRLSIERKRFGKAFQFTNPPVSLRVGEFEKILAEGGAFTVTAYAKLYDYGTLSLIFEIPVVGMGVPRFIALARYMREACPFDEDFNRERKRLTSALGSTLKGAGSPEVEEDYAIYMVRQVEGVEPTARGLTSMLDPVEMLLGPEGDLPPGRSVREELMSHAMSYTERDLVVLNWDNALVYEPSGSMDIPDLLEYANAHLLEVRVYDRLLDRELESIYPDVTVGARYSVWRAGRLRALARRVMLTITEVTEITERIDNSLKVTDDVYYAKLYSAALKLFKVHTWEAGLRRKIDTASRVHGMLHQEISTRRAELLEAAIVALIVIEIVLFIILEMRR